ncbi:MAG: PaaX family transcriptional regulator [Chloroflexi bacterium]|nr:PaaX family transcriptional regulator [Chloroflexota bacterium]
MSRNHDASAPNARGLLFTILGELVLPCGGLAWTSALINVFARLGVEEKAARQALMRTAAAGWLDADHFGRRTQWRLTPSSERLLRDGAQRIYSFSGCAPSWGGQWLLVSAHVPEAERSARHVLRRRLTWAGFGSLAPGLWISPHPERLAEAIAALRAAGVASTAHVFAATRAGVGNERRMVATAWNLPAIQQLYQQFLRDFRARTTDDVLVKQLELVHAWRRFPSIDPLLPRLLLPSRWSGEQAARVFADHNALWSAAARSEWQRLNGNV